MCVQGSVCEWTLHVSLSLGLFRTYRNQACVTNHVISPLTSVLLFCLFVFVICGMAETWNGAPDRLRDKLQSVARDLSQLSLDTVNGTRESSGLGEEQPASVSLSFTP